MSMTLFAKDREEIISAWDAHPKKTYQCLCCNSALRYRRSKRQFPHFYHISKTPSCRLYGKSETHLLIQIEIQKQLRDVLLEKPFPPIRRIADVAWEKEKIIFEIQCSSISEKEAKERELEYQSLGYKVVWILDDTKFNKRRLSYAEAWMRQRHCYFVNGSRFFYDQSETIQDNLRTKRSRKIPIDLSNVSQKQTSLFPQIEKRKKTLKEIFLRLIEICGGVYTTRCKRKKAPHQNKRHQYPIGQISCKKSNSSEKKSSHFLRSCKRYSNQQNSHKNPRRPQTSC